MCPDLWCDINHKAYIPLRRKILASGAGVGQYPPTAEFCVGDTNMLVSENANICVSPNANPRRQPVEYRWRWVSGVGHVYFMLFVHHFPRWLRENWPTQRQIPVEYGLKNISKYRW